MVLAAVSFSGCLETAADWQGPAGGLRVGVVGDSGIQEYTYDKIEKETGGKKTYDGTGGWIGSARRSWQWPRS